MRLAVPHTRINLARTDQAERLTVPLTAGAGNSGHTAGGDIDGDGRSNVGSATGQSTTGVLFAMCLSLVLVVATVAAINLALPDLAVDLGANTTQLTWIADGYTVALAALVLPFGAIGDRIGRRRVLLVGTLIFGLAALAASFATTTTALIAWRVVMGVGAAMIMPGTLATITGAFPPERRTRGIAIWSGFAAAGAILGLLAAGTLLEFWGWQAIFTASAGAAVIAGLTAALLAPETKETVHRRLDIAGGVLSAVAIGALVFAIIEGADQGWSDSRTVGALTVAALGTLGYVLFSLRHESPLLDPRLFALRGFHAGALTIVVQFMAIFGFFFIGLQYLQLVLGYSPLHSAVALIPVAVVVLPTAQATPAIVDRLGLGRVMTAGLLLLAAGIAWTSRLQVDSGYSPFLIGLLLAGVGIGLTSSTGTTAIVSSLPVDEQGVASAVNDTTRELGSAIGVALMGAVYGSHYRAALPPAPQGAPADVVQMVQDSAAAGIEVARRLGPAGDPVAAAVRQAFVEGLSASLVVMMVIIALSAVVVALRAPNERVRRN